MTETKWNWLGDHLAVDLANTVIRRGSIMTELLNEPGDLAEWLEHECGRVPYPEVVDAALLETFLELRDDALALLRAASEEKALPPTAVANVNAIVSRMPMARVLGKHAGSAITVPAHAEDPRQNLLATLADAIVDLLGERQLHHLAFCDAPSCGQFFHRQRPNQHWCCSACGDRARAARHQKRSGGRHES
ncbi:CGNR zinc finger domain-containing protein [Halomonas sp. A29]|uniref:CGNR zinc finger domain-containing protein n=1 Tax=Halomonas sp. A29 TaxID=3102786 RepID=UPI00398B851D